MESPAFTFTSYTKASDRHPERNEDTLIIDQQRGLAAVFDGVGGSTAGDIASQIAGQVVQQGWERILQQLQPESPVTLLKHYESVELGATLSKLVQEAHEQIRNRGTLDAIEEAQRPGIEDQATTIALAVFCQEQNMEGYTMLYASVGDSRIYLLREGNALTCLTRDDSFLTKLVQGHVISEAEALRIDQASNPEELSETEHVYFNKRNGITQALGDIGDPQALVVHIDQVAIRPGDRILLCTDGIHDNLTNKELAEIIAHGAEAAAAKDLVEHALQRSRQTIRNTMRAKPDDISAIVVTCNH
ncbi:serine/threonine-protein phosphatase [Ktedonobacteria bacterium brp13]|nr:serine/threonine-protein phosphatase [Ktedonobacteria bacterium brp13]